MIAYVAKQIKINQYLITDVGPHQYPIYFAWINSLKFHYFRIIKLYSCLLKCKNHKIIKNQENLPKVFVEKKNVSKFYWKWILMT